MRNITLWLRSFNAFNNSQLLDDICHQLIVLNNVQYRIQDVLILVYRHDLSLVDGAGAIVGNLDHIQSTNIRCQYNQMLLSTYLPQVSSYILEHSVSREFPELNVLFVEPSDDIWKCIEDFNQSRHCDVIVASSIEDPFVTSFDVQHQSSDTVDLEVLPPMNMYSLRAIHSNDSDWLSTGVFETFAQKLHLPDDTLRESARNSCLVSMKSLEYNTFLSESLESTLWHFLRYSGGCDEPIQRSNRSVIESNLNEGTCTENQQLKQQTTQPALLHSRMSWDEIKTRGVPEQPVVALHPYDWPLGLMSQFTLTQLLQGSHYHMERPPYPPTIPFKLNHKIKESHLNGKTAETANILLLGGWTLQNGISSLLSHRTISAKVVWFAAAHIVRTCSVLDNAIDRILFTYANSSHETDQKIFCNKKNQPVPLDSPVSSTLDPDKAFRETYKPLQEKHDEIQHSIAAALILSLAPVLTLAHMISWPMCETILQKYDLTYEITNKNNATHIVNNAFRILDANHTELLLSQATALLQKMATISDETFHHKLGQFQVELRLQRTICKRVLEELCVREYYIHTVHQHLHMITGPQRPELASLPWAMGIQYPPSLDRISSHCTNSSSVHGNQDNMMNIPYFNEHNRQSVQNVNTHKYPISSISDRSRSSVSSVTNRSGASIQSQPTNQWHQLPRWVSCSIQPNRFQQDKRQSSRTLHPLSHHHTGSSNSSKIHFSSTRTRETNVQNEVKKANAFYHGQTGEPLIDAILRCIIATGTLPRRHASPHEIALCSTYAQYTTQLNSLSASSDKNTNWNLPNAWGSLLPCISIEMDMGIAHTKQTQHSSTAQGSKYRKNCSIQTSEATPLDLSTLTAYDTFSTTTDPIIFSDSIMADMSLCSSNSSVTNHVHPALCLLASYWCKHLSLPWGFGASFIASYLIDCDMVELIAAWQWTVGFILEPSVPAPHPHNAWDPQSADIIDLIDPYGTFMYTWASEYCPPAPTKISDKDKLISLSVWSQDNNMKNDTNEPTLEDSVQLQLLYALLRQSFVCEMQSQKPTIIHHDQHAVQSNSILSSTSSCLLEQSLSIDSTRIISCPTTILPSPSSFDKTLNTIKTSSNTSKTTNGSNNRWPRDLNTRASIATRSPKIHMCQISLSKLYQSHQSPFRIALGWKKSIPTTESSKITPQPIVSSAYSRRAVLAAVRRTYHEFHFFCQSIANDNSSPPSSSFYSTNLLKAHSNVWNEFNCVAYDPKEIQVLEQRTSSKIAAENAMKRCGYSFYEKYNSYLQTPSTYLNDKTFQNSFSHLPAVTEGRVAKLGKLWHDKEAKYHHNQVYTNNRLAHIANVTYAVQTLLSSSCCMSTNNTCSMENPPSPLQTSMTAFHDDLLFQPDAFSNKENYHLDGTLHSNLHSPNVHFSNSTVHSIVDKFTTRAGPSSFDKMEGSTNMDIGIKASIDTLNSSIYSGRYFHRHQALVMATQRPRQNATNAPPACLTRPHNTSSIQYAWAQDSLSSIRNNNQTKPCDGQYDETPDSDSDMEMETEMSGIVSTDDTHLLKWIYGTTDITVYGAHSLPQYKNTVCLYEHAKALLHSSDYQKQAQHGYHWGCVRGRWLLQPGDAHILLGQTQHMLNGGNKNAKCVIEQKDLGLRVYMSSATTGQLNHDGIKSRWNNSQIDDSFASLFNHHTIMRPRPSENYLNNPLKYYPSGRSNRKGHARDAMRVVTAEIICKDLSLKDVLRSIAQLTLYRRWDRTWESIAPLGRLDSINEVWYLLADTPAPPFSAVVAQRDIVAFQGAFHDVGNQQHVLCYRNGWHSAVPPSSPYIRAIPLGISGFTVSALNPSSLDRGCIVTFTSGADFRGKIPTFLVNFVAKRSPATWVKRLRGMIEQLEQEEKECIKSK